MEQVSELKVSKRVVELGEAAIVLCADAEKVKPRAPNMVNQTAKVRAMTVAMVGILAMPLLGLMAGDQNLWEKLQSLVETERAAKTQSTVLAVDTTGLSVRSKSSSPTTKALFEQAAMEHLARLHHTFNSWSERDQELMGSVSLKLMVDSSGNVVRVDPMNSHVNNSSFMKTVMDDVREWKFPKGGAEAAEITVPLLFIPKGMDPDMIVQWERKVGSGPRDDSSSRPLPVVRVLPASDGGGTIANTAVAQPTPSRTDEKSTVVASPVPPVAPKAVVISTSSSASKTKAEAKPLPIVVANRQLAIRDNPRYSANRVREVEEATQLSVLESRGDWLKVRTAQGGVTGFIRKEYVSPSNG
ncbi:MAG TPA: AgmX/PglI C-terminal domain-containing protein [Pyrinomonadaceae bacterium]